MRSTKTLHCPLLVDKNNGKIPLESQQTRVERDTAERKTDMVKVRQRAFEDIYEKIDSFSHFSTFMHKYFKKREILH